MAGLDDLIDLISETDLPIIIDLGWEQHLTRSLPNWKIVIAEAWKDPLKWERIENSRPKSSRQYSSLCKTLVSSIGLELAKRWFYSNVDEQIMAVKGNERFWFQVNYYSGCWLFDNRHLWSEFDFDMKNTVLTFTFNKYPGEPLESLKRLIKDVPYVSSSQIEQLRNLLNVGYVPSPLIEQLRNIIQEAGDGVYSVKIDEMISRREKAWVLET